MSVLRLDLKYNGACEDCAIGMAEFPDDGQYVQYTDYVQHEKDLTESFAKTIKDLLNDRSALLTALEEATAMLDRCIPPIDPIPVGEPMCAAMPSLPDIRKVLNKAIKEASE